jgi:hypothetical protein
MKSTLSNPGPTDVFSALDRQGVSDFFLNFLFVSSLFPLSSKSRYSLLPFYLPVLFLGIFASAVLPKSFQKRELSQIIFFAFFVIVYVSLNWSPHPVNLVLGCCGVFIAVNLLLSLFKRAVTLPPLGPAFFYMIACLRFDEATHIPAQGYSITYLTL